MEKATAGLCLILGAAGALLEYAVNGMGDMVKMCIRDRPKPVPFCLWVMNGSNIVDRSSGAMPQPVSDIVITTCWFWKAADKEMAA